MSYILIRTLTIFGDCSFKATQLRPYRYMGSYLIPKGNHEYLLYIHTKYTYNTISTYVHEHYVDFNYKYYITV